MQEYDFVVVSEEWLAKSFDYGTMRHKANGGNDTPAYAHSGSLPYSSLTASRLSVVGEVAAHLYFGVDPESTTYFVERTQAAYEDLRANADLTVNGRKVEVRNATDASRPIPIKEKDVAAGAIVVQVLVQMSGGRPTGRVYFLGWADAVKDYEGCYIKRNGTAYKSFKRDMSDLAGVLV